MEITPLPTMETILIAVAQEFGVKPRDILGLSRLRQIALARHVAAYVARTMANMSYPAIGSELKQSDHTSAMHAVRRITELIAVDPTTAAHVANIKRKVQAHTMASVRMGLTPPYRQGSDLPGLYYAAPYVDVVGERERGAA